MNLTVAHESSCLFGILWVMDNKDIVLKTENKKTDESGYSAMVKLSDNDRAYAKEFSKKIDLSDTKTILQYGYQAQKHVMDISDRSLNDLPQHDYEEIIDDLTAMKKKIASFEKETALLSQKMDTQKIFTAFKSACEHCSSAINETARRLEIHRSSLLRHHARLEDHYDAIMKCIREYDMYIYAGGLALQKGRTVNLAELLKRAEESGLKEDVLIANDYAQSCTRMEKRLSDLSLSRQLPFQMCTQIRMMQNTDVVIAENLRALCANAFPLWKNRMALVLGAGMERVIDPEVIKDTDDKLIQAADALIRTLSINRSKQKKGILNLGN